MSSSKDPVTADIGDPNAIHHALDDAVHDAVLSNTGAVENNTFSNIRLALGFVAICLTALGHFYPVPFPQNWSILAACVALYFVLHTSLYYLHYVVDCDYILITKSQDDGLPGICVKTSLQRYETDFKMTIARYTKDEARRNEYVTTLQITDFFDSNGLLLPKAVQKAVDNHMAQFLQAEEKKSR